MSIPPKYNPLECFKDIIFRMQIGFYTFGGIASKLEERNTYPVCTEGAFTVEQRDDKYIIETSFGDFDKIYVETYALNHTTNVQFCIFADTNVKPNILCVTEIVSYNKIVELIENHEGLPFEFSLNAHLKGLRDSGPYPMIITVIPGKNYLVVKSIKFALPINIAQQWYVYMARQNRQRICGFI